MQHLPEAVSAETIKRAILSKLLSRHGLDSPFLRLPLAVRSRSSRDHGRNWDLDVPENMAPIDLEATVVEVARHYNLRAN